MGVLVIIIILVALAGIADAINDTLRFHYLQSRLPKNSWWNPSFSWKRKWKITRYGSTILNTKSKKWYYLWLYKPNFVEKFMWSSTVLVFTTDAFHFFKSIRLNTILLSIAVAAGTNLLNIAVIFLLIRVVYGLIFELFFKKVLSK